MTQKLQTYPKYKPSGIDGSTSLTTSWLGNIPFDWKTKRNLGLFSERNERVKHFAEEDFELLSVTIQKGVVRQLELAEDEQRKDSSNEDKGNYKWVRRGDIAYNKMRMWQGAAGESKYGGIVSPAYIILKPKTGVLPRFLKVKDMAVIQVYRRDSKRRNKKGFFTGVSNMIQFADFFTGVILSLADKSRKTTKKAEKHKNIYRKTLLSKCPNLQKKLEFKENYYWPNFQYQKINVFYWKPKQKASRGKSPSRS